MGCRMDVVITGMKTLISSVHCHWAVIFWKEYFCTLRLSSGLKIFSKLCCKQICGLPGFVVQFIEHRQSRFNIILKSLRMFWMVSYISLSLKSPAALAYNRRVHLSFEARHWLLSRYGSPRWHLLPTEGCFIYIENLWFSAATFVNYLDLLHNLLQLLHHQHLLLHLILLCDGDVFFP